MNEWLTQVWTFALGVWTCMAAVVFAFGVPFAAWWVACLAKNICVSGWGDYTNWKHRMRCCAAGKHNPGGDITEAFIALENVIRFHQRCKNCGGSLYEDVGPKDVGRLGILRGYPGITVRWKAS